MHRFLPATYKRMCTGGFATVPIDMDTIYNKAASDPLRSVFIVFLWVALAFLAGLDLVLPPEISLIAYFTIPALVAAVFVPARQVLALAIAAVACGIFSGVYFGILATKAYSVRIGGIAGIGVLAVALASARSRQSEAVENERARIRATLDSLFDPHVLLRAVRDATGQITDFIFEDANDAACQYNRIPRAQMIGHRLLELLPAHVATGLLDLYRRTIESGRPLALDDYLYPHEILEKPRYFDIRAVKVGDALSYTWRDVTERHLAAAVLDQRARTDELTKLLSRREIFERLEDLRGKTPRTGRDVAVLFVDFDHFKNINDTYGHAAGDTVLRTTAERIRACLRSSDDLGARVGGDEMMVVLHGVHGLGDAVGVADKLRRSAAAPVRLDGQSVEATVSVGVALAHRGESTAALVARADAAMYEAKQRGRNQVITVEEPAAA